MNTRHALPAHRWRMALRAATSLTLVLLSAACSKGKESKAPARDGGTAVTDIESACDKRDSLGLCIDFTKAAFATGEDFVRSACTGTHGRYAEAPCPAEERVGSCAFGSGQVRHYYGAGGHEYAPAEARRDCEQSKGKWSVPGRVTGAL